MKRRKTDRAKRVDGAATTVAAHTAAAIGCIRPIVPLSARMNSYGT
jgi:hypothetical protein